MSLNIETDWLGRWNLYSGDKVALLDYKTKISYTYHQMYTEACSLASYLKTLSVKTGDRVAVLSQNRIETLILFFALQRLGAILVPINYRLTVPEVNFILLDSGANILFYEDAFKTTAETLKHSNLKILSYDSDYSKISTHGLTTEFLSDFESPCMVLYTSGTTGFPKGAVLTHKMLFWNAVNTALSLNITQDDVTLNFAPLFHTGGWNVLMTPFFQRGAKVIFFEKFEAQSVLKACEIEKVSLLFGVPTMLSMMAETSDFKSIDLSSIRYMIVGGEPMPLSLIQKWHQKGVPIRQGFGLTEFGPNCFSLSEKDAETKMGSIGRPNFYVQTKIVDENNAEVNTGEIGELLLSGPSCMKEYWNNPIATKEAIVDGWLHSGDLVRQDSDQYFYVVGRKKEMFISGGENVYPVEIERVLQSHPDIFEVAVVGVKDEKWGEVGHAYISTYKQKIISSEELKDYCRHHLAGYKVPKFFSLLQELPKGDSGKINKKMLIKNNAEVKVKDSNGGSNKWSGLNV